MTNEERKVIELALEALTNAYWPTESDLMPAHNIKECADAITAIKEALSGCQCPECQVVLHASDCAVHNEPAYPKGQCNCGAQPQQEPVAYTNGTDVILAKHWTADYPPEGWEPLGYTTPPQRKPLTSQERDAKRWRFLMENSYDSESVTQFHVWEHSWEPHSQTGEPTEWKQRVRGIALIDFIDRAIEAAHGIKE